MRLPTIISRKNYGFITPLHEKNGSKIPRFNMVGVENYEFVAVYVHWTMYLEINDHGLLIQPLSVHVVHLNFQLKDGTHVEKSCSIHNGWIINCINNSPLGRAFGPVGLDMIKERELTVYF